MIEADSTWASDEGPSALAGLARLVVGCLEDANIDPEPFLEGAGLSREAISRPGMRIPVRNQIAFLNSAAKALDDDLLGFRIGRDGELRELGFLYYVMASAQTLGEALSLEQSYSWTVNEGIRTTYSQDECVVVDVHYPGVERELVRHEMEFWLACTLKKCRRFTGKNLVPTYIGFAHARVGELVEVEAFFGLTPTYEATHDRLCLDLSAADLPLVNADPYLMSLLTLSSADAECRRGTRRQELRERVENSIVARLPEGSAQLGRVAEDLGMSPRTLTRRLADEEESFSGILDALRAVLAKHHLADNELSVSQIAWLLGYSEISSFVRAMRRWTGAPPGQFRTDLQTRKPDRER